MTSGAALTLDVYDLYARGWTEALIRDFLGTPDGWEAVDHFRNTTGKRTYFLERVERAEASDAFGSAYQASLRRRKTDAAGQAVYQAAREKPPAPLPPSQA